MSSSPACCPTLCVTWRKVSPPRSPLCLRLCTSGPHRIRSAADAGPLLKRLQALRPDSQSQQDEGASPTCTKHPPPRHPTVSLMTHYLAMLNISSILEAPFLAMAPLTKKSTQESARQARRCADSATECSTKTIPGY